MRADDLMKQEAEDPMGVSKTGDGTIQARIGIMADYAETEGYEALSPETEAVLRQQHQACVFGTKEADVKALLASAVFNPEIPNTNESGHPGVDNVLSFVAAAVNAFNALDTGLSFVVPADSQPTCVENEWVNGELITRYNYLLPTDPPEGPCPPPGPPKADFRIQLRYVQP